LQLLAFKKVWTKYFSDIQLILGGIGVMIIGQMVGLTYGQGIPPLANYITCIVLMYAIGYPIGTYLCEIYIDSHIYAYIHLCILHLYTSICIYMYIYIITYTGHTAVLGAFSKIQKSGPQGALLGWFATAGNIHIYICYISSIHFSLIYIHMYVYIYINIYS
jgi:hypothetical protein